VRCKRVVAQQFSQRPKIVKRNTSSCGGRINFLVSLIWQELKATGNDNYINDPKGINCKKQ